MTTTTTSPEAAPALPPLSVLGTGYLGATHAICMAVLATTSWGSTSTPARSPS
jgi:UDPglucose 6-dehydrogenase